MEGVKHMPVFSPGDVWLYKIAPGGAASHNGEFGTLGWALFALR
jgi:hypothetical protein